jgi:acyl-coenzyme A thioesterase PaaI-like protein
MSVGRGGEVFDETQPAINEDTIAHHCFGCGDANPHGLRLRFRPRVGGGVWARFSPTRDHEGYLGMTHGGILATLLDEAMSWAVTHDGDLGVTARMTLTFRQPARVGDELLLLARVVTSRARVLDTHAEARRLSDDALLAEAEARFIRVSKQQAADWRAAYGVGGDATSIFGRAAARNAGESVS